jgi:hypothetical protein
MMLPCVLFASLAVTGIDSHAEAADIRSVAPDLAVPALASGPVAADKRVKQCLPAYAGTQVYHVIYLPSDWQPDARYPVIVEYAGNGGYRNKYGDVSTGCVEGSKLGYGISAGVGAIWVCLPYVNDAGTANVSKWWGDAPRHDPQATIAYCKRAVPWICTKYGGDPRRVVLVGFSRGAIACNYIGLHDDDIAELWCAFVPFSHYDGVFERWGYSKCDRQAARQRLRRLGNRPQFICAEAGDGKHSIQATSDYLKSTGVTGDFTFCGTGYRNHNDAWVLRPSPARDQLRRWVRSVTQPRE